MRAAPSRAFSRLLAPSHAFPHPLQECDERIAFRESEFYENQQSHARELYSLAKQRRDEEKMAGTKHGYLAWKRAWWEREFERLHQAAGLQLDWQACPRLLPP